MPASCSVWNTGKGFLQIILQGTLQVGHSSLIKALSFLHDREPSTLIYIHDVPEGKFGFTKYLFKVISF